MSEYLKSKGIYLTPDQVAEETGVPRRTLYWRFKHSRDKFDGSIATIGKNRKDSGEWYEYRQRAMIGRSEYDEHEYVSVLLLGIAEEYINFMEARVESSSEAQVEIFGLFLWNVAELCNILDEFFSVEMASVADPVITSPYKCISIVREHGAQNVNKIKLVEKAVCVARGMVVAYTTMITAQDAMVASLQKIETV